jgi:hypothetical protein
MNAEQRDAMAKLYKAQQEKELEELLEIEAKIAKYAKRSRNDDDDDDDIEMPEDVSEDDDVMAAEDEPAEEPTDEELAMQDRNRRRMMRAPRGERGQRMGRMDRDEKDAMLAEMELKRAFSPKKRRNLAKEGMALPDGSFPIVTTEDLKNAIQAFGRAKNQARTKRHIMKRARALDAENLIPEAWKSLEESMETKANIEMAPKEGMMGPMSREDLMAKIFGKKKPSTKKPATKKPAASDDEMSDDETSEDDDYPKA